MGLIAISPWLETQCGSWSRENVKGVSFVNNYWACDVNKFWSGINSKLDCIRFVVYAEEPKQVPTFEVDLKNLPDFIIVFQDNYPKMLYLEFKMQRFLSKIYKGLKKRHLPSQHDIYINVEVIRKKELDDG